MTVEQYLEEMKPGFTVPGGSDAHLVMHEMSQKALQITMELNNKYHTHEEIIQLMSELTGHEIDDSFGICRQDAYFCQVDFCLTRAVGTARK